MEERYFVDTENCEIISISELIDDYESRKREIELDSGATNFDDYLMNCTGKNGFLKEVFDYGG